MAADSIDLKLCRRLADLEYEKTVLEEKAKRVQKSIEALWERIYPMLVGRKSQPLEDGVRLQPKRSLLCTKRGGVDARLAVQALKDAGLDWLCREDYETGKLKEHVISLDEERKAEGDVPEDINDILPEALRPIFRVMEKNSVVVYGVKSRAKAAVAAEERSDENDGQE